MPTRKPRPDERTVSGAIGAGSATRNVKNLRNNKKVTELVKDGVGFLTDISGQNEVCLEWDLNDMAYRDRIFRITIGDQEAYIDMEELMFHTRIMFAR